ncbi:MAG: MFS transporter [Acidobacteriia bacterium]|nr:MFS transporter [Terriglobia bacterium]
MPSAGALWRDREFLKLWSGQTISQIGSRITRDGLPYTAVLMLHASPLQMGLLVALGGTAALAAGPLAGVLADRYRRRPTLIWADLGRAAVLSLIPLAALSQRMQMWQLYIVAALAGALTIVFDSGYQAYLPVLVRGDQLLEGNRKLALSNSTAEVLGPGMTGFLVKVMTGPIAILLDAASFVVSALSILAIQRREPAVEYKRQERGWHELTAGFRTIAAHPLLRPMGLRTVTAAFFSGFLATLYTLFGIEYLGLGPAVLGVLITLGGFGNFFGAWISERIVERFPLGKVMIGTHVVAGLMWLLIPLAHGPWYVAAAFLGASQLFGDMAYPIYDIHELTLRQSVTPPEVLGRVNACMQMLFKGVVPLGSVAGGLLAQRFGVRFTLTLAALGIFASSLWLIFSPVRALRGHMHPAFTSPSKQPCA